MFLNEMEQLINSLQKKYIFIEYFVFRVTKGP